jgi:hypothetical protein
MTNREPMANSSTRIEGAGEVLDGSSDGEVSRRADRPYLFIWGTRSNGSVTKYEKSLRECDRKKLTLWTCKGAELQHVTQPLAALARESAKADAACARYACLTAGLAAAESS